jgi:hypothetical protein
VLSSPIDDVGYRVGYPVAADNLHVGRTVIADSVNPIQLCRNAWGGNTNIRHCRIAVPYLARRSLSGLPSMESRAYCDRNRRPERHAERQDTSRSATRNNCSIAGIRHSVSIQMTAHTVTAMEDPRFEILPTDSLGQFWKADVEHRRD